MPDTDVLYADVKFNKTGRKATGAHSPSHDTTYSQVNIVKTQPTTDRSGSERRTNGRSKVTAERVALVVLSVLLIVAVSAFIFTYLNSMENKGQGLTENATVACPDKPSPACDEGWEHFGDKCYYFSAFNSTWNISRMFCIEFRADLVKIDSEEEQRFLLIKVSDKMAVDKPEDKFWIGLTDSETEGTWLWVDGSKLEESLKFWWNDGKRKEPDDWKGDNSANPVDPDGEDCARMGEKESVKDLRRWLDKTCKMDQRSICEKPAKGRQ